MRAFFLLSYVTFGDRICQTTVDCIVSTADRLYVSFNRCVSIGVTLITRAADKLLSSVPLMFAPTRWPGLVAKEATLFLAPRS